MKVYTLTGKSGTGKSFQALNLCKEYNIEAIIDDGLFIYQNKVMAGTSAKREKTKVGAIKAAMFIRAEQRDEVKKSIESVKPESILIIGTSDGMAEEICEQLGLPEIYKVIHIEDITTEREREKAWKQRRIQGKHVIPVPSMQLKRDFAGYFIITLTALACEKYSFEPCAAEHKPGGFTVRHTLKSGPQAATLRSCHPAYRLRNYPRSYSRSRRSNPSPAERRCLSWTVST